MCHIVGYKFFEEYMYLNEALSLLYVAKSEVITEPIP